MKAKPTVIIFCVLFFGIAVLNVLSPSKLMSESENRQLQQMPVLSRETLLSGDFTRRFEGFITDQFVARDSWVGAKTAVEVAVGRKSAKSVYFAKDNYLIEMFDSVDPAVYSRNLGFLAEFARMVEAEQGVDVQTMLVPTASAILKDKLPAFAPEIDQSNMLREAASVLPHFVDVTEPLNANSGEYIFYRTDHHWTSLGALCAYNHWRVQNGEAPHTVADFETEMLSDNFYGTTYSKAQLYSTPPDEIFAYKAGVPALSVTYDFGQSFTDTIYERSFLEQKDKYSVFLNANQPNVQINTGLQNDRRLLLIKDSYANAFVQPALADFEQVHVIDLRYYRKSAAEYITEHGITDVLVLYNLKGFSSDPNLLFLVQPLA